MSIDQYKDALEQMQRQYSELQNKQDNALASLETTKESNQTLTEENEFFLRKITGLQTEINNMRNHQARLESQLYSQERQLDDLKKENQSALKTRREIEKKLASELLLFEKERLTWQETENELSREIRALKHPINGDAHSEGSMSPKRSINGRSNNGGNATNPKSATNSPFLLDSNTPLDSPPSQDPKEASLVKAHDRIVANLKSDIDVQKQLAADRLVQTQWQASKISQLENELAQVQQMHQSVMEDNESYQILLHEKTMNGEFMMNPIMQQNRFTSSSSLATAEENVAAIKKANNATGNTGGGLNLAAELGRVESGSHDYDVARLTEEIKNQKDENKALALYINKILLRIMTSDSLIKDILSIDPPEPPKPATVPTPVRPALSNDADPKNRRRRTTISFFSRKNSAEDDNAGEIKMKPSVSSSGHSKPPSIVEKPLSEVEKPPPEAEVGAIKRASSENLNVVSDADAKSLRRHSSAITSPPVGTGSAAVNRNSSFFKRISGVGWPSRASSVQAPIEEAAVVTEDVDSEREKEKEKEKLVVNGSGEIRKSAEVQVLGEIAEEEEKA